MIAILNAEPEHYSARATALLETFARVDAASYPREVLLERIADYDALIVRLGHRIDAELLDAAKRLRVVATATTGLDHIDLDAARQRGIEVVSLRGEVEFLRGIHATAEHTWALLLALLRRIPAASTSAASGPGGWERDGFRGRELHGRHLGVVGCGRLGEKVVGFGLAFGMRVSVFDPHLGALPQHLGGEVTRRGSLLDLMEACDVVSLHVPLAEETRGLVGEEALVALGAEGVLVNTSRGAVVEGAALLRALESCVISGAALDVLEGEPHFESESSRALLAFARKSPRLLVTPHIGGATLESMEKTELFVAEKLRDLLAAQ